MLRTWFLIFRATFENLRLCFATWRGVFGSLSSKNNGSFCVIVNAKTLPTIFAKVLNINVWYGPKYVSTQSYYIKSDLWQLFNKLITKIQKHKGLKVVRKGFYMNCKGMKMDFMKLSFSIFMCHKGQNKVIVRTSCFW